MVGPHRHRQGSNRNGGVDQGLVAKDWFAAKGRENFRDDTEEGQRDDVDLGMAKEPEEVLPQNGPTIRRVIHMRTKYPVTTQCQHGGSQNGEG